MEEISTTLQNIYTYIDNEYMNLSIDEMTSLRNEIGKVKDRLRDKCIVKELMEKFPDNPYIKHIESFGYDYYEDDGTIGNTWIININQPRISIKCFYFYWSRGGEKQEDGVTIKDTVSLNIFEWND